MSNSRMREIEMVQPAHALELQLLLTCCIDFFILEAPPLPNQALGDIRPGEKDGVRGGGSPLLQKRGQNDFGKITLNKNSRCEIFILALVFNTMTPYH